MRLNTCRLLVCQNNKAKSLERATKKKHAEARSVSVLWPLTTIFKKKTKKNMRLVERNPQYSKEKLANKDTGREVAVELQKFGIPMHEFGYRNL